jgi:CheY-like chemotaxis protein
MIGVVMTGLRRVVLVDDNPYDNEYATIILRKAGFRGEITVYTCGEDALEGFWTVEHSVDLLLLDINMPGMNGFEFARAIARVDGGPPPPVVIVLTSSPDPRDIERAQSIDVIVGWLTKPLTVVAVAEIIERLADRASADRASDELAQAEHHLPTADGLDQVGVRAAEDPADLVGQAGEGGEHDDR